MGGRGWQRTLGRRTWVHTLRGCVTPLSCDLSKLWLKERPGLVCTLLGASQRHLPLMSWVTLGMMLLCQVLEEWPQKARD